MLVRPVGMAPGANATFHRVLYTGYAVEKRGSLVLFTLFLFYILSVKKKLR